MLPVPIKAAAATTHPPAPVLQLRLPPASGLAGRMWSLALYVSEGACR
jgi:hypothetical protein